MILKFFNKMRNMFSRQLPRLLFLETKENSSINTYLVEECLLSSQNLIEESEEPIELPLEFRKDFDQVRLLAEWVQAAVDMANMDMTSKRPTHPEHMTRQ